MSDADQRPGDFEQPAISFEDEWFLASDGEPIGPFSASEALRMIASGVDEKPTHIWHPSFSTWRVLGDIGTAAEAQGAAATPAMRGSVPALLGSRLPTASERDSMSLDDVHLSNALFIACLACAIAPLFILGAAFARDIQDNVLTSGVLLVIGWLAWWLYVEYRGVRLQNGELIFPVRARIWPYVAWRKRTLPVADIAGFECWTNGRFLHWVRVNTGRKSSSILFDNALHRVILQLALEQELSRLTRPDTKATAA